MKTAQDVLSLLESSITINVKNTKTIIDKNNLPKNELISDWNIQDPPRGYILLRRVTPGKKYPSPDEDTFILSGNTDKKKNYDIVEYPGLKTGDIVTINPESDNDLSGDFMVLEVIVKSPRIMKFPGNNFPLYIFK